jgi:hypothetical protein
MLIAIKPLHTIVWALLAGSAAAFVEMILPQTRSPS